MAIEISDRALELITKLNKHTLLEQISEIAEDIQDDDYFDALEKLQQISLAMTALTLLKQMEGQPVDETHLEKAYSAVIGALEHDK